MATEWEARDGRLFASCNGEEREVDLDELKRELAAIAQALADLRRQRSAAAVPA